MDFDGLLNELRNRFGVTLQPKVDIAQVCGFPEGVFDCAVIGEQRRIDDPLWAEVRMFCEQQRWLFSRQGGDVTDGNGAIRMLEEMMAAIQTGGQLRRPTSPPTIVFAVYLAPIRPMPIVVGYHTTRLEWVPSIQTHGLLPRHGNYRTSSRLDCDGNVYIAEELGEPSQAEQQKGGSAHWWRGVFARETKSDLREWAILEVRLDQIEGLRIVQDLWSKSGRILLGTNVIPPARISQVFP